MRQVLAQLKSSRGSDRAQAVRALALREDPNLAILLSEHLNDRCRRVRLEAIRALAILRARAFAPQLLKFLSDPHPRLRDMAAWACSAVGAAGDACRLKPLLKDPDLWTRCHAVETLGFLRQIKFAPQMARLLDDRQPLARGHALLALADCEAKRFGPRIARCLRDRHPAIRAVAALALAELARRDFLPLVPVLLENDASCTFAVTAVNVLKNHRLYRRLRTRRLTLRKQDRVQDVLALFRGLGLKTRVTRSARKWLKRPFMAVALVQDYDLYRLFWDVCPYFEPGGMGYVITGQTLTLTTMDEACARLKAWALGQRIDENRHRKP